MIKSMDREVLAERPRKWKLMDTYADDRRYTMDVEKVVAPEYTGKLRRVQSLCKRGHKIFRDSRHDYDMFLSDLWSLVRSLAIERRGEIECGIF